MKKFLSYTSAGLMMALAFTSCKKDEVAEIAPVPVSTSDATDQQAQIVLYLTQLMQSKDQGNGAVIIEPQMSGFNLFLQKDVVPGETPMDPPVSGEVAFYGANYGPNDFWRVNPDGSTSIHLVSNEAFGSYTNYGTGESYSGQGHMNVNMTGTVETIVLPFPPFPEFILFFFDPSMNAANLHGQANVTLNGEPGKKHKLKVRLLQTPGGQNNTSLEFH